MTEYSWFWEGSTTGDAQFLTNDEFTDVFKNLVQLEWDKVLMTVPGYFHPDAGDEPPTNQQWLDIRVNGVEETVTVYEGGAIIDGKVYWLRKPITFTCASEGYYRLVLRKEFPALDETGAPRGQVVNLMMLYDESGEIGPTSDQNIYPIPVRSDGVTWDMTIGMFYNKGLGESSADPLLRWYPYERYYHSDTYRGSTLQYEGNYTDENGKRLFPYSALHLPCRQGGSATNWATSGTTKYIVPMARIEIGSVAMAANPQAVVFHQAFSGTPVVMLTPQVQGTPWTGNNFCVSAVSSAGFSIRVDSLANLDNMQWVAIGPV